MSMTSFCYKGYVTFLSDKTYFKQRHIKDTERVKFPN